MLAPIGYIIILPPEEFEPTCKPIIPLVPPALALVIVPKFTNPLLSKIICCPDAFCQTPAMLV